MSLRTKQALILFLATVLPFALGAAAVHLVVGPAYRRTVRQASVQETQRLAEHVAWGLARDVTRLEKLAAWEAIRDLARRASPAQREVQQLEAHWDRLPSSSRPIRPLLQNLVARELRWWQETDASAVELFATDRYGRLIAASRKPSNYLQRNEDWWKKAYAGGQGGVYVSDVSYDESAGVWVVAIAVPIYADGASGAEVVGTLKVALDAARAFQDVRRMAVGEGGQTLLVDARSRIVVSPENAPPLAQSLDSPRLAILRETRNGSFVEGAGDEALLFAWSLVPMAGETELEDARIPRLYVVTRRGTEEALAPLRMVQRWMLAISLVTITAAVVLGYWLADVLVVRQVRKVAAGMRELARGDFVRAAEIADELSRSGGRR
jgi:hypothetical protein